MNSTKTAARAPSANGLTATNTPPMYIALELGWDTWLLACATRAAEKPRFRPMPARNLAALKEEIARAKKRFGLPENARVCTVYEAGRDGFWLHRAEKHASRRDCLLPPRAGGWSARWCRAGQPGGRADLGQEAVGVDGPRRGRILMKTA